MQSSRLLSKLLAIVLLLTAVVPFTSTSASYQAYAEGTVADTVYNLASGKIPSVTLVSGDPAQTDKEKAMMGRLTDGIYGDGDWQKNRALYVDFFRNTGRSVIVNLGETSTVKELNLRAMQDLGAGIYAPRNVLFYTSADGGQTWSYLGTVTKDQAQQADAKHFVYRLEGLNYQANMVKYSFEVDVWIFADELQALGKKGIADNATIPPANDYDPYKLVNAFPAPGSEQVRGARNDYLVYGGYHTNGTVYAPRTAEELLPAVAYIDKQGQLRDWLYDSFTFLPYATSSKNRSYIFTGSVTKATAGNKDDWQEYLDYLFDEQNQLAALNKAVGEAKQKLNNPSYQAKVKIAIPKAIPVQSEFGVVDGVMLNFDHKLIGDDQALQNRVKANKWYIDQVLSRWDPARYPNLRFDGFYWLDESVQYIASNREEELIKETAAYIHSKDKIFYWIPYYQAAGFFKWHDLGFDYAVLQPNYAFQTSPDTRPTDAAVQAKRFGLGVEMEVHWNVLTDAALRQKYIRYLDQGVTAGYMTQSVLAWYWSTDTLQKVYASQDPVIRDLYERTYAFIKGTYPSTPEGMPKFTVSNVSFTDLAGQPLTQLEKKGFVRVNADIQNAQWKADQAVLVASLKRKKDDSIESMAFVEKQIVAGGTEKLSAGFSVPSNAKDYYVEVAVWNNLTEQKPMSDVIRFGYEDKKKDDDKK